MSLLKYRHIYRLTRCNFIKGIQRNKIQTQGMRCCSQVAETKDQTVQYVKEKKPLTNVPLAKDLFLGEFDPEYLVFPELSNNEEVAELEALVASVEKFFDEDLDSKSIDANAKIPDDVLQQVKDLGLFGLQIPLEFGGLDLNATKFARIAEATAMDGAIAVTLAGHNSIGLKGILISGTDVQKEKYLPRLATGELVAAFALTEPSSGSDAASIQTRATLSEDGKTFLLNGSKIWISNGGIADVFTVFARTEITNDEGEKIDKITAFIVERAFGGVTSGKPEDKLGIRGSNTCEVHFDNTPVPIENVLGGVGGGFKMAMNILNSGRFSMGSSGAGAIKKIIGMVTEHAISRKQFGKSLSEFGLIQEKFAKMTLTAYAMESMAYLTAGLIDKYEKPDLAIEAAMVKVFSSEGCWDCINESLQILGGMGYMKDYPYERYLRDARILMIFEGTNEILRLFIGLQGMQHAGGKLLDMVKKMRKPLDNPGFVIRKTFEHARRSIRKPTLEMKLYDHVHVQLREQACYLETKIYELKIMVEQYLSQHGKNIINEQMAIKRFADIVIALYAMIAVLSRASRSMSIGLRNGEHEILLAETFCKLALYRIDANLKQLDIEKYDNGDEQLRKIAEKVFQHGGYFAEHALKRNW